MGDIQERLSVSSSSSSSSSSLSLPPRAESLSVDGEVWMIAEERIHEILCTIQPVIVSDRSRNEIIDYVRTLIKNHDGIEVFSFGSVPLKTYLPDGDIDLTVLTKHNKEEELSATLCNMLEREEHESDFQVTDVQYIRAQVKVIKCNIRNIAVDISFNQMSGLCALCFLEQVDQLFGRDHLFKRSIILIKAWCYYESRTLGANTGLISTYALAVLVLYIINLFHSSLSGPLAVLYKFLEYYGSFDWDNYCITVNGPVLISSLPELMASPENGHELFISEKFFRECLEVYSVPTKAAEANGRVFPIKHLNIVDPLKHSNNLGRSVTKGNFRRVKNAFAMGARSLRDVLTKPGETMGWRLEMIFTSSLDRNGKGQRQDVNDPISAFGTGRSELSELTGDFEGYFRSLMYAKLYHGYRLPGTSIPVASQLKDPSAWDIVRQFLTNPKNGFYCNVPTSIQPFPHPISSSHNIRKSRGTGTYFPDTTQQLCSDKFRNLSTENSSPSAQTHKLLKSSECTNDHLETSADATSSCYNPSNEVSTSCTCPKGESDRSETCNPCHSAMKSPGDDNRRSISGHSSASGDLVAPLSSSILGLDTDKEKSKRSSETSNGSEL